MNGVLPVARAGWPLWLGLGGVVVILALLMPATGDDWRRIDLADRTLSGFLGKGLEHYRDRNGRLAGNTLSYALMEPVWLRALAKGVLVTALVAALHRVSGGRTGWHALLCAVGVLLLPFPVFRQAMGWSTGFFYYVPPVVGLVLLVGTAAGRWPAGRRADTWWAAAGCAVLGALSCLFIEHVTVAVLGVALGGLGLTVAARRRPTPALCGWAAGAVTGTAVMLASPGLHSTAGGGSTYYGGLGEALGGTMVLNYGIVTRAFVLAAPVILGLLLTACLVHGLRGLARTRAPRHLLAVLGVLLVGAYALVRQLWLVDRLLCTGTGARSCDLRLLAVDLAVLLVLLAVMTTVALGVLTGQDRVAWAGLLAATLLMLGPLLLVQPIGPRNLHGPLVTVLGMAALTARPLVEGAAPRARPWQAGIVVTAVLGVAVLTAVLWANAQVAHTRVVLMEEAVASGRTEVVLPAYPYPHWVHGADDRKIGYRYYLDRRYDIEIRFER